MSKDIHEPIYPLKSKLYLAERTLFHCVTGFC